MPDTRHHPERPSHRLGTIALLTALAFGCTTIRAPVASLQNPIPIRDGSVEPQLELWLESADPIGPEEAARVSAEARAAIEEALAGYEVGDGSLALVVRAQGVTRSPSHRSDQRAATVGLVLGAVVVVVAVVILIASGGKSGGGGSGHVAAAGARGAGGHGAAGFRPPPVSPALPVAHGAGALAGGARAAPVRAAGAAAVAVRPPPPPQPWSPPRLPPGSARPPPYPHHHDAGGYVAWGVYVDPGPVVIVPVPGEYPVVSSRDLAAPLADPGEARVVEAPPPPEGPVAATQVVLPALAPFPVEERGFFAGDALTMELTLVDRLSGEARWVKWVETESDPCDREAVRHVLRQALAEPAGWVAVHVR